MSRQIPRLALPGDWSPAETWYVRVPIPGDPEYLEVLAGWVAGLTYSVNHDRDETKTGAATVSRTWQRVLGSLPIERIYDVLLRQNPSNLCQLQRSDDGGETWVTWADMSQCGVTVTPTYTDPLPDGRTPGMGMIDDILWGLRQPIEDIITNLDAGDTPDQAAQDVNDDLLGRTGLYLKPGLLPLAEYLYPFTPAQRATQLSNLDWASLRETIVCETIDVDPVEDTQWFLQKMADNLLDALEGSSDTLFRTLNYLAEKYDTPGAQGWSTLAWDNAGQGGGFGFTDVSCYWTVDFDFTVSDHGWVVTPYIPGDIAQGEYVPGVGFRSTWGISITTIGDERVTIARSFDQANIIRLGIWYTIQEPFFPSANGSIEVNGVQQAFSGQAGTNVYQTMPDQDLLTTHAGALLNGALYQNEYEPWIASGRKCYITKAQILGRGPNPFI